MTMTCVAECTAINKKTRAKMFSDVKVGDTVVFAGGVPLGIPGRTNMIRVCIVE